MSLFKYFQPQNSSLPKSDTPLSVVMPSSNIVTGSKNSIENFNKFKAWDLQTLFSKKEGPNSKYAAEHGVTASIRHFKKMCLQDVC